MEAAAPCRSCWRQKGRRRQRARACAVLEPIGAALSQIFQWPDFLLIPLGMLVGLFAGLVPGLNAPIAMAILLPVTFDMTPVQAMMLLVPIIGAADVGGSLTAILVGVPGTSVNVATTLDGHMMARQGRAAEAIGASVTASAMGSLIGLVVLVALLPVMRSVVMLFGPPEFFLLALSAIVALSVLTRGHVLDGLIAGATGLVLSSVGFNPVLGGLRYTFGWDYLWDGFHLIPFFLGLYGITESLQLVATRYSVAPLEGGSRAGLLEGVRAVFRHWGLLLRSSAIGMFIGAVPVLGGTVAALVGYAQAKQTARDPEAFGRGDVRGVIAPESANDAKDGGALVTTLALGIPGSEVYVVLLGAFLLHGILPGRSLLTEHQDVVWTIILAMVIGNLMRSATVLAVGRILAAITRIPTAYLSPVILMSSLIGAYAVRENPLDPLVALAFGFLGLLMERFGIPRLITVIAFILGPVAEHSFFQSLQISGNDWSIFVTRPVSAVLVLLLVVTLVSGLRPRRRAWSEVGQAGAAAGHGLSR